MTTNMSTGIAHTFGDGVHFGSPEKSGGFAFVFSLGFISQVSNESAGDNTAGDAIGIHQLGCAVWQDIDIGYYRNVILVNL
jgi:hypothetical protein